MRLVSLRLSISVTWQADTNSWLPGEIISQANDIYCPSADAHIGVEALEEAGCEAVSEAWFRHCVWWINLEVRKANKESADVFALWQEKGILADELVTQQADIEGVFLLDIVPSEGGLTRASAPQHGASRVSKRSCPDPTRCTGM